MYNYYPGLSKKLQSRVTGFPEEDRQQVLDQVAGIFSEFLRRRAPQHSSQSMSPYLMANGFNFDVTEIIEQIKAIKRNKEAQEAYANMPSERLEQLISDEPVASIFYKVTLGRASSNQIVNGKLNADLTKYDD